MSNASDYLENKLVDQLFRGQAAPSIGTLHVGLFTAAPSDSGGGVEVAGNAYARATVASSLANWAGTQGAGTTAVSSGTTGATSNNGVITFQPPAPAGWGLVTHFALFDSALGGTNNMIVWGTLSASKTINAGDTVTFPAAALTVTIA